MDLNKILLKQFEDGLLCIKLDRTSPNISTQINILKYILNKIKPEDTTDITYCSWNYFYIPTYDTDFFGASHKICTDTFNVIINVEDLLNLSSDNYYELW